MAPFSMNFFSSSLFIVWTFISLPASHTWYFDYINPDLVALISSFTSVPSDSVFNISPPFGHPFFYLQTSNSPTINDKQER